MADNKLEQFCMTERAMRHVLEMPFAENEIQWRAARSGWKNGKPWAQILCYLTSRAVMDRLDLAFGIDGWETTIEPIAFGNLTVAAESCKTDDRLGQNVSSLQESMFGAKCTLQVRFGAKTVSRSAFANMSNFEGIKGADSDSLKRVAVQFGIGRYLYNLGDSWAVCCPKTGYKAPDNRPWKSAGAKDGAKYEYFWWTPPEMEIDFLPSEDDVKVRVAFEKYRAARLLDPPSSAPWDNEGVDLTAETEKMASRGE